MWKLKPYHYLLNKMLVMLMMSRRKPTMITTIQLSKLHEGSESGQSS